MQFLKALKYWNTRSPGVINMGEDLLTSLQMAAPTSDYIAMHRIWAQGISLESEDVKGKVKALK
jgi:hypothetical protein